MKIQHHTPSGVIEVDEQTDFEKAKSDWASASTVQDKINVIAKLLKVV